MLTQCPSCSTLFRVTAAILKIGHGQVRCGKCRTQFDALESIQDEELTQLPTPIESENAASNERSRIASSTDNESEKPSTSSSQVGNDVTNDEASNEETDFEDSIEIELSADGELAEPEESSIIVVESQQDFIDEETFDASDEDSLNEDSLDQDSADENNIESFAEEQSEVDVEYDISNTVDAERASFAEPSVTKGKRHWLRRSNRGDQVIADELAALTYGKPVRNSRTRLWAIASVALLLVWVVQIVHHHRDNLVRSAQLGSMVTRVYNVLGLSLTPRWDLAAYELQQWGVVSDPKAPDTLRVRASVTNRAQFSQPYPLIRLELQDRWGAPVATRVFASDEYLPEKTAANRLLSPKQRANAEIVIADPGNDAIGFQIHACMRYEQSLSCSDE